MPRSFDVGIVGLGAMGHAHALACRAEPGVALVAGCDIAPARRETWGQTHGVPAGALYADYQTMLDRESLDLVVVATHADTHAAAVVAAARRGVHVFCEKPPASVLRAADEMLAACDAAGVHLAINHIKRGSNGNAVAQRLIAEGAIGTPYLIRAEGKGKRWAGSELMEMGTHLFDWLRLFAGDARWLHADVVHEGRPAGKADIVHSLSLPYPERDCGLVLGQRAYCSVAFVNGLHADVGFLMQPTSPDPGYGLDVVGTEGTLALRRSVGTELFLQRGHHRGPVGGAEWEPIPVDELAGLDPPVDDLRVGVPSVAGLPVEVRIEDRAGSETVRLACQRRLLRDLLEAITAGRPPLSSGRDGVAALELVMAVWQSARVGGPVAIPLQEREHPLERWRDER
jgi:predicted dehydrogenase